QLQQQPQRAYRGNDYLPPTTTTTTAAAIASYPQQQHQQQKVYRGPAYLPPIAQPQQQQHVPQVQQQQVQQQQVQQQQVQQQQVQQQQVQQQAADYHAPGYLPPGYEYANPDQLPVALAQAVAGVQQPATVADYRAPDYLPPSYNEEVKTQPQQQAIVYQAQQQQVQQQQVQQQQVQQQQVQQQLHHPGALPDGYEFSKPDNFEAAIAELHSLQTQTKLLKQQQQQQQLQLQQQQLLLQQQQAPPTQHTHIHTLSSYMNTVQPFARYGQPQQQQHVQQHVQQQQPHVQQQHVQPQQFVEVAPMYREQSKRPRFYAPAMSYASNALPTQYHEHHHHHQQHQQLQHQQLPRATLSLQAQQSLQKFMPREMQMAVNVAVAAASPVPQRGSSRVRTVQIVKPHAARTFKVLETLDAAGVKTIKILGTSHVQPKGQHHVVKVVTQDEHNVESHVQTVKIYDDEQEYDVMR
ncbi:bromodomain-containing protein DDB_G0280777, partial [Drosophila innubila]|uniref:bromodomain-containing protein DDB_G0280777 n=1 Tax=Drosophila innubila TaxID=198719 RepID=UPI00148DC133